MTRMFRMDEAQPRLLDETGQGVIGKPLDRTDGPRKVSGTAPYAADGLPDGAAHVTALPYFLSADRHVAEDIPEEVEAVQAAHPDVHIEIAPYLGTSDVMPRLLLTMRGDSAAASA